MSVLKNIGITLLLVAPFYLWSIYDAFFESRSGYIYDPASDQLYWLQLRPHIYRFQHWKRHLLPFSSPPFTEISYVERQASLVEELAWRNRPFDLESFERESDRLWQEPKASMDRENDFIDAEYWPRHDLDAKTMLPPQWRRLPEKLTDFDSAVIPADVIIARVALNRGAPIDFQILRGVLFLSDAAADLLDHVFPQDSTIGRCTNRDGVTTNPLKPRPNSAPAGVWRANPGYRELRSHPVVLTAFLACAGGASQAAEDNSTLNYDARPNWSSSLSRVHPSSLPRLRRIPRSGQNSRRKIASVEKKGSVKRRSSTVRPERFEPRSAHLFFSFSS
jgi:hypothetical protein